MPYLIIILVGIIFLIVGAAMNSEYWVIDIGNVFLNIAAALIVIPIVYFGYEKIRHGQERQRNRDLVEYSMPQVEEIIIRILQRIDILLHFPNRTWYTVTRMSKDDLRSAVAKASPLGFQRFGRWRDEADKLAEITNRPTSTRFFSSEQLLALVKAEKAIRALNDFISNPDNFTAGTDTDGYALESKFEVGKPNAFGLQQHFIRLMPKGKKKTEDEIDFDIFWPWHEDQLLKSFSVKKEKAEEFSGLVWDYITQAKNWIKVASAEKLKKRIAKRSDHLELLKD